MRTGHYRRAFLENHVDFRGKVIAAAAATSLLYKSRVPAARTRCRCRALPPRAAHAAPALRARRAVCCPADGCRGETTE